MERLVDSGMNIDVLCDAIVDRYHASLEERLPRIRDELALITATAASPALELLRAAFDEVAEQIAAHLTKEEHLLFPAIAALSNAERQDGRRPPLAFATVLHPIRLMEAEHGRIEMAVNRLRELARAVSEPNTLSPHWHHCVADLAKLDAELREHHRTENEVLFPRALDLERRLL
jgi:regulator of cell morphogenesis and NO signaling